MRITSVRINGMPNPIGFRFDSVRVSWVVEDTEALTQTFARIEIAEDELFSQIIASKEGDELSSICDEIAVDVTAHTRYFVRVSVEADNGETAVSDGCDFFETGKIDEPWSASWIMMGAEPVPTPIFRRTFSLDREPLRALLTISGLGFYRAFINGERVGDEWFTPNYSDYTTEVQYQTYPIENLRAGENEIAVLVGDGWYKSVYGLGHHADNFGDTLKLIAELSLCFDDGSTETIVTDDRWTYQASDIAENGIYDGEVIDRLLWSERPNEPRPVALTSYDGVLVERYSIPVLTHETMPVREVIQTPAGETVLDFGQNFAGIVSVHAHWPRGTRLVLDFGEILQDGNFYNANYRTAKSQFVYVSDGRDEVVEPTFTFFGFRYGRVSGLTDVDPADFTGYALYSAIPETGRLSTGNPKVNQLISNVAWSQRSNSIDIPTDCPQRDERLGWTGDAQVFSETACYLRDVQAFFAKFLHEVRVVQRKQDGKVPCVIPDFDDHFPMAAAIWGDIATLTPQVLHDHYGDRRALAICYPMMRDWVDYIDRHDRAHNNRHLFDFDLQLADWVALDGRTATSYFGGTDGVYVASVYYAMSATAVADAAETLGQPEEAAHYRQLAAEIRTAIIDEYFTANGRLAIDTQTGYILALASGIHPDKAAVVEGLRTRLLKDNYKIKGGFSGAPIMCQVMAENGLAAEALYFFTQENAPGWLHEVNLGATTIWERWNSVGDDGHISPTEMNSLNHFAFGSVLAYAFRDLGGLRPLTPGFTHALIKPQINAKLTPFAMTYRSVAGTWSVSWELTDGEARITIGVPFNARATVDLPGYEAGPFGLGAGVHTYRYPAVGGLFSRYSIDTHFEELADDEAAMAILRTDAPAIAALIDERNEEILKDTLRSVAPMTPYGMTPALAEAIAEKLERL